MAQARSTLAGENNTNKCVATPAPIGKNVNKSSSLSVSPARALSAFACPAVPVSTNASSSMAPNATDNDATHGREEINAGTGSKIFANMCLNLHNGCHVKSSPKCASICTTGAIRDLHETAPCPDCARRNGVENLGGKPRPLAGRANPTKNNLAPGLSTKLSATTTLRTLAGSHAGPLRSCAAQSGP